MAMELRLTPDIKSFLMAHSKTVVNNDQSIEMIVDLKISCQQDEYDNSETPLATIELGPTEKAVLEQCQQESSYRIAELSLYKHRMVAMNTWLFLYKNTKWWQVRNRLRIMKELAYEVLWNRM